MAEKGKQPEETPPPSPQEQIAVALEKIREILPSAVFFGEDGPVLDLDLFTRLLIQRAIEYRTLNREIAFAELGMVRAEQDTQKVRADGGDGEANQRLDVLRERERVILDQLWPLR